jgi:hypothetical protein
MNKEIPLFLLSCALLSSCARSNVPQELVSYINGCSISNAIKDTKTIDYTFSIETKQDDSLLSSTDMRILYDNQNSEDFYRYQEENYTGELITYDDTHKIYLTRKERYIYFDSSRELYQDITYYIGYEKEGDENKRIKGEEVLYKPSQIESVRENIFRSQSTSSISKGGVYYADFFSNLLSYYDYMKIEDGIFTYTLENYPYKNNTEEGLIDEVIHMNQKGLLIDLYQKARNTKTKKESIMNVKAVYDSSFERRYYTED